MLYLSDCLYNHDVEFTKHPPACVVVTQVSLKLARGDIGVASEKFQSRNDEDFIFVGVVAAVSVVSGGGPLSTDLSLCLLWHNGPGSG